MLNPADRYGAEKDVSFPSDTFINETLFQIQRGSYTRLTPQSPFLYEPPSIEMYTKISLKFYFAIFWGMLFLQTLVIMAIDHWILKCLPENMSWLERILHAHLKSHFPFPEADWDAGKASCKDRIKRQKDTQREVLLTTIVNLVFALLMLFPLRILRKILNCIIYYKKNATYTYCFFYR